MNWIDGTELGADGVRRLAARALELRSGSAPRRADGKRLAAVFLNPSLRTRVSLEGAAGALGVQPLVVQPGKDAWGWEMVEGVVMDGGPAEHIKDAVQVLAQYADALAVRSFAGLEDAEADRADPVISAFARYAPVPVINLESALWHPLQGLADAATWQAHLGAELSGAPLCLSWAPHPGALPAAVANQVLLTASLLGMDVRVAAPEGFDLDPQIVARAEGLAAAGGGSLRCFGEQAPAVEGARVVLAKSWSGFSGYGDREAEAARRAAASDWTIDEALMARGDAPGFMHCLPVRRNVVVADAVIDGPASWVHEQAGLRLWTAMALLEEVLAS